MAIILHLETATRSCSVALSDNDRLLALKETQRENSHAEMITVFIQEALTEAGLQIHQLDAVAVSKGPGSYTGLRIGVSTAKGICYALNIPLLSVNTLFSLAQGVLHLDHDFDAKTLLCPMIDARRMEVYYALFDLSLNELKPNAAEIITSESFSEYFQENSLLCFGDGAEKCKTLFEGVQKIQFIDDVFLSAQYMIPKALERYNRSEFENTAYFEPFYLKDFIAGAPNVKGLK